MPNAAMPGGLTAYKRTPTFDQDTLPAGLRREHRTNPGVWALIHVVEGSLRFRIFNPPSDAILTVGMTGLVSPEQPHEVEALGPMRMFVEFYSVPDMKEGPPTSQLL